MRRGRRFRKKGGRGVGWMERADAVEEGRGGNEQEGKEIEGD